jgi:hypothetical protein
VLSCSVLVPLYKGKGARDVMDNYRGIAVLPLLAKLYAHVLARRLSHYLECGAHRSPLQFGFRGGRGTLDALLTLHAALGVALPTPADRVYAAFVDFRKAFDSVCRDRLWARLTTLGVPLAFRTALESYYSSVLFQVNTADGLTEPLSADLGVKQGCPLSPVLFGAFVEVFTERLAANPLGLNPPTLLPTHPTLALPVPSLLFADDLTLLSTTPEGLQRGLAHLATFSGESGLSVNTDKTKVMVFRLQAPDGRTHPDPPPPVFSYRDSPLEFVTEFRYLGFPLGPNLSDFGSHGAAALLASAKRRFSALWAQCRAHHVEDPGSLFCLFDSLVGSVLGYGSPVFAPLLPPSALVWASGDRSPAETLHRKALRMFLGLPSGFGGHTPTVPLLLEAGRVPVPLMWLTYAGRFLSRVCRMSVGDPVQLAVRSGLGTPGSWVVGIQAALRALAPALLVAGAPPPPFTQHSPSLQPLAGIPATGLKSLLGDLATFCLSAAAAWQSAMRGHCVGGTVPTTRHEAFAAMLGRYRTLVPTPPPAPPRALIAVAGPPAAGLAAGPPPARRRLPGPQLTRFPLLSQRALISGLRLLPTLRGLPISAADPPNPSHPLPADVGPCPSCQGNIQCLEHALSCPGDPWLALRVAHDLPIGASLHSISSNPLPRLPAFLRAVVAKVLPSPPLPRPRAVVPPRPRREGAP